MRTKRIPRLPVITEGDTHYSTHATCPWCHTRNVFEPHSLAVIHGGTCLISHRTTVGGPASRMEGCLRLHRHGAHDGGAGDHRDIDVVTAIVRGNTNGQFDLIFCATTRLRAVLHACVDTLKTHVSCENPRM